MTIYALSTAHARAGIAVIRISGKAARRTLEVLCQGKVPLPRAAGLRSLRDPRGGEVLDRGLVLWFPGPASYTGEDMAELHLHGGRAVIAGVLDALCHLGLRMAEPGEFTRRAFENSKLDLTEAEGLADLINAETVAQRQQALTQSGGALRQHYENWRAALLRAMAYVEASLDFSDESDIAADTFAAALPEVRTLIAGLDRALADGRRGEIVREGIHVAIIGPPNAGKSSLLNALLGRDAAIVFDEPGTTRDVIVAAADFEGFPFILHDTAGLRETGSAVEREGIRRALAAAEGADIVLALIDASAPYMRPVSIEERVPAREGQAGRTGLPGKLTFTVLNKIDLAPHKKQETGPGIVAISAKSGYGLNDLKAGLVRFARENYVSAEMPLITRARHRQEIERARGALASFLACAGANDPAELAAEHLREAGDALGRLTGRFDVEDVLGQIFSEFCIGK